MTARIKGRVPLPGTVLLTGADADALALDRPSFTHLKNYLSRVEGLPADFETGSAATAEALNSVRAEVRLFGSPRELRRLLSQRPNALADEYPPPLLYGRIVAVAQRLHESATAVVSILQSLNEPGGSHGDVNTLLQLLGTKADNARAPIGPLAESLKTFKGGILAANRKLSAAAKADAEALREMQETVGGLRVRVQNQQEQLDRLGLLTTRQKRSGIEEQLHQLQRELADVSALAVKRRAALGLLEPIVESGQWLGSGVDDVVDFMETLSKVWTAFGSSVMQLAADSSSAELEDPAGREKALSVDEAVRQWSAIDRAAKEFVEESLVDVSSN
jgi:hypothetical protein